MRVEVADAFPDADVLAVPVGTDGIPPGGDLQGAARIAEEEARASCWSRILRPVRPILAGPAMSRGLPAAAAICLLVLAGIILQNPGGVILPEEVTADARIESIQPDQVERMLDEIEMLRQLRITPAGDGSAVNAM